MHELLQHTLRPVIESPGKIDHALAANHQQEPETGKRERSDAWSRTQHADPWLLTLASNM